MAIVLATPMMMTRVVAIIGFAIGAALIVWSALVLLHSVGCRT